MFIQKLNFTANLEQVRLDLEEILIQTSWEPGNQIGLTHRKNTNRDLWKDSMGGGMNRITKERYFFEEDFTEFNSDVPRFLIIAYVVGLETECVSFIIHHTL